ncbi:hypothetical protein HD806DRAFT_535137 [Xylariaceae sp. AK1471]|nr:hypothetical protein HD806DRAFT_535137 [Xylariaceae sp. AK1471]
MNTALLDDLGDARVKRNAITVHICHSTALASGTQQPSPTVHCNLETEYPIIAMLSSLEWRQTSPGIYQRDIDRVERFYLAANSVKSPIVNKADWYVNAGVKLECSRPAFVADIRSAWVQTRVEYPSLAAVIEGDGWVYREADREELSSWLRETFHVHREPLTARELMSTEELVPASRIVLHVLPNTQELLIQGPHTHLDGFGITRTFQHIMTCLTKLPVLSEGTTIPDKLGGEGRNLTPAMSSCCHTPPYSVEDHEKWNILIQDFINPKHKLYLIPRNATKPPGLSRTQWLEFDQPSTKLIQQEARNRTVSLAAIVQGAISLTARALGGHAPSANRHAIQALFSAREYLDPAMVDGERVVSPLVLGVPLTFELHDDFQDLITDANRALQQVKVDDFGLKCSPLWGSDLPKAFAAPLPEGWTMMADTQMSYVGSIDTYLADCTEDDSVEDSFTRCVDFWPSVDMLSANVVTSVFVFRGHLNLCLAYNETYHAEEGMTRYLETIKSSLDHGLGIETVASVRTPGREKWMPEPVTI